MNRLRAAIDDPSAQLRRIPTDGASMQIFSFRVQTCILSFAAALSAEIFATRAIGLLSGFFGDFIRFERRLEVCLIHELEHFFFLSSYLHL